METSNQLWEPFTQNYDDEGIETITSKDQKETEKLVSEKQKCNKEFQRIHHRDFLLKHISGLPPKAATKSGQDPWFAYWYVNSIHALTLNKMPHESDYESLVLKYLQKRYSKEQQYTSSPLARGHIILSYVAINTIATIGTPIAFSSIDRSSLYDFLMSLKNSNGSFSAEPNDMSEADTRSTYAAIHIASLLNILTPELTEGVVDYIVSCQGYDGGFSPLPSTETHGAYTFCSLAALDILHSLDRIDLNKAVQWAANRQMSFEGGFNGRTNKLVDTCYAWWVGASCRILADHLKIPPFWNQDALETYVLSVCQFVGSGGICDKPGKIADLFHTMYGTIGISATRGLNPGEKIAQIDPRHGITKTAVEKIKQFFH